MDTPPDDKIVHLPKRRSTEEIEEEFIISSNAAALEELCELNIAQKMRGLAYVVLLPDGDIGSAYSTGCLGSLHQTIAGLEILKNRLIRLVNEEEEYDL
ncbi:MAG: hypothetical protein EBV86_14120 [Marivivens sp.]|nr:hypothetical protein [Marivivens sp.]